jgi:hypothetical protein
MTRDIPILLRLTRRDTASPGALQALFRATGCAVLFLFLAWRLPAQSPATPAQPPPAGQKDSAPKASAPAKPKKVITNEDLEPRSAPSQTPAGAGKTIVTDSNSLMKCDATCEQEARQEAGYDEDREAEWRMQIVSARSELAADSAWRELLGQAIQQTTSYCNLLAQESQKVSPSSNTWNARVQRARAEQYYENMEHSLQQSLQAVTGRMNSTIESVSELSPVRAALMRVQASRILGRECELPSRR